MFGELVPEWEYYFDIEEEPSQSGSVGIDGDNARTLETPPPPHQGGGDALRRAILS